ncbi:MAG: SGNH/GDSL hydrolase family protein [Vicinamibacterales bacterium]
MSPTGASRLPLRRKMAFALVVFLAFGTVTGLALLGADVYAHARSQDVAGVNIWGYRGAPVGRKQAGETRVVILGGSTAFGWGLPAHEAIGVFLERRLLADPRTTGRRVSVVDLGAPGQGVYGIRFDLEDFAYLDYDIVVLYEGYNDLGRNKSASDRAVPTDLLGRRRSLVFRLTGYYPILPVLVREKAMAMLSGGDLDRAYAGEDVVFRPGLATRATARTLKTAAEISQRLAARLGGLSSSPPMPSIDTQCVPRWTSYCGDVQAAVSWALERNKHVVFVTQPYISDLHIEQQDNVVAMLEKQFGGDQRLRIANLGRAVDLRNRNIAYDGMHLVAAGNDVIAAYLVDPVLESMRW